MSRVNYHVCVFYVFSILCVERKNENEVQAHEIYDLFLIQFDVFVCVFVYAKKYRCLIFFFISHSHN